MKKALTSMAALLACMVLLASCGGGGGGGGGGAPASPDVSGNWECTSDDSGVIKAALTSSGATSGGLMLNGSGGGNVMAKMSDGKWYYDSSNASTAVTYSLSGSSFTLNVGGSPFADGTVSVSGNTMTVTTTDSGKTYTTVFTKIGDTPADAAGA